jgi:hypothetical protein
MAVAVPMVSTTYNHTLLLRTCIIYTLIRTCHVRRAVLYFNIHITDCSLCISDDGAQASELALLRMPLFTYCIHTNREPESGGTTSAMSTHSIIWP